MIRRKKLMFPSEKSQKMKLLVYRLIAPAAVLVVLFISAYEIRQSIQLTLIDYLVRSIFLLAYLLIAILLWVKESWLYIYERIIYFSIVSAYVIQLYANFRVISNNSISVSLISTVFWIPMIYFLTYLVFDVSQAIRINLVLIAVLLIPGIVFSFLNWGHEYLTAIWSFYLAHFSFILSLYAITNTLVHYKKGSALAGVFEEAANKDYLTQLNNRRSMDDCIRTLIKNQDESSGLFSIILMDLDRFKLINDTYGHLTGDQILKGVADRLKQSIREGDILGRWGGEEFILLTPSTTFDIANQIAERLRNVLCKTEIEGYEVTASFGVSEWRIGDTTESLVKRADSALYLAKENGRNRVEICP